MDERATLIDEALDRDMRAALDVVPSQEFVARVRTRVAGEQAAHVGWWARRWVPVAALTVAVAVSAIVLGRWPSPPGSVAPADRPGPGAMAALAPGPPVVAPSSVERRIPAVRRAAPAPVSRLPDVLFSADERHALDMLVRLANGGQVDAPPAPKPVEVMDVDELAIVPLDISELPSLARLE